MKCTVLMICSTFLFMSQLDDAHAQDSVGALIAQYGRGDGTAKERLDLLLKAWKLNQRTKEISAERALVLRAWVISQALEVVRVVDDESKVCGEALPLSSTVEALAPTKAELSSERGVGLESWVPLLLWSAYCHRERGERDLALVYLQRAEEFEDLRLFATEPMKELFSMVRTGLHPTDAFRIGGYVTNDGIRQLWIARVEVATEATVSVRFTYVADDTSYSGRRGRKAVLPRESVKPLSRVSTKAVLRGWR